MRKFKGVFILIIPIFLVGCFQAGQTLEDIDVPQSFNDENLVNEQTEKDVQAVEPVTRELYLIDAHGHVVAQKLQLPKLENKAVAEQVLNYLIKDGPVTELLPNGFSAVLPADTEVLGLNLQDDGTLTIDVSEHFSDYPAEEERQMLEAMTYTLTQFPNVERIKIQVNGTTLDAMPVNGTPIAQGYTRDKGINLSATKAVDLLESERITMYYPREYNESRYYVPITEYVEKNGNIYQSIVQILLDETKFSESLIADVFDPKTTLISEPVLKNDVLQLHFNEYVLDDIANGIIADEVMETLVRTFTGLPEIEAIEVHVQNIEEIFNEQGEVYDRPVSINTFSPAEKM